MDKEFLLQMKPRITCYQREIRGGPVAMGGAATSQEKSTLGGWTVFSHVRLSALGVRMYQWQVST